MRMIGHLDSGVKARGFSDYLTMKGIENRVESEKDGTWTLWILSEEQLQWAKDLFALYQQNPADPNFQVAARALADLREQKRKEQEEYEKRVKKRRHLFRPLTAYGFGPVTFSLIFASVVICIIIYWTPQGTRLYNALLISLADLKGIESLSVSHQFLRRIAGFGVLLPEIRKGEVWRLFTPIFIHYGFFHIFFNMLCLRDLGSMIEARQNSWVLLALIAMFAAISNLAQFLVAGHDFGGMSGVVYGLIGYIWIRGKYDPGSGLFVHSATVTMALIWFFACLIGVMGPIANVAHAVGLLMGMAWGFISSLWHR
jgi:GlpG protein